MREQPATPHAFNIAKKIAWSTECLKETANALKHAFGYAADTQRAQCAIAPTCGLTHGHGNGRVHHFEEVPVQFMQVLNTRSPSGGMPPGEWERVGDAAEWASSDLNGACADCAMATPIMSSLDEIASGVPPGLLRRVQRAASSLATLGQHRR